VRCQTKKKHIEMSDTISINGIPIRLPEERWSHITSEHGELYELQTEVLEAVSDPESILEGNNGALMAVKEIATDKWLVVVYRETELNGFIITAFLTRRKRSLDKRKVVWKR